MSTLRRAGSALANVRPRRLRKNVADCLHRSANPGSAPSTTRGLAKLVRMKLLPLLVLGCACALPLSAAAQWQWIDKDGRTVFSDQPPPAEVPEKNIRRSGRAGPGARPAATSATTSAEAGASPLAKAANTAAGGPAKPTGVDKELEERARKAEEDEKAKRAAEELKVAQAKAENCQRARKAKATLDSGIRVARLNDQGEREMIDDKARAAEQQRMEAVIATDCK